MSNNDQFKGVKTVNTQGNQQRPNSAVQEFTTLSSNRLGRYPSFVGWNLKSEWIENAVIKFFNDHGVNCEDNNIYIRAKYNPQFNSVMRNGGEKGKPIMPFTLYIIVMLDAEARKNAKRKGARLAFNVGEGGMLKSLQKLASRSKDKGQLMLLGNPEISKVAGAFTRNGEIKWNTTRDGKAARTTVDTMRVLNYVFDIPEHSNKKFTLDFVSVKENKHNGSFSCTVLKNPVADDYRHARVDPMQYIR